MRKRWSNEELRNIIINAGYELLDDVDGLKGATTCITADGYKVIVHVEGIIRRGDAPKIFSKHNPYTIENINLYIQKNSYTCKLLTEEYIDARTKMLFQCECGKEYYANLDALRQGKRYCNFCAKSKRYDGLVDYNKLIQQECDRRGYTLLPGQDIKRSSTIFDYICNKHPGYGVQHSYPNNFITEYGNGGCYQCCIDKRSMSKRRDDQYFRQITENAGMIYVGIKRPDNARAKILFECPKHREKGVQETMITNMKRLTSGNCKYCVGRLRNQEDLQKEIDALDLDIDVIEYSDYSSPILVKCRLCDHIWNTKGVNLTQGHGCPNCSSSRFERDVKNC